ncbi:MAG: GntR family transcriptional regulator [Eubacterium sp.]|nr:GntR family transcriptional regulator [Eubacterium sp.]
MSIVTDSLQEQIRVIIKERILGKIYLPGEQIPTKEIAQEFGISNMPVRNSLQELASLGLVVNRERVGFFVKRFNLDEALKIMEVRELYETYSLEKYFNNINRNEMQIICEQSALGEDKKICFRKLDILLHGALVKASNNDYFIDVYMKLQNLIELFANISNAYEHLANREHIDIATAILNSDCAGALQALKSHLFRVSKEIEDVIVSEGNN